MSFDGSCSKTSAGAGIWLYDTENNHSKGHSYKLNFQCKSNIVEYEALLLGLHLLKKLGAQRITVHGNAKLVIRQVNEECMVKHPRLRAYKDDAMDFLKYFKEFQLTLVPKNQNIFSSGLALVASTCLRPCECKQYILQEKFRLAVPNNEKYWQVFGGEKQIKDCPTKDISSFQEEPSPIVDIILSYKEPKFTSEASIELEKEEIPLLVDLQVKDDDASKEHTKDAVLKANVLEADNLPIMEGQK